jgi:hypothetical protein
MSLLLSLEGYTLSHLKHTIADIKSLSSLSRFFAKAPWSHQLIIQYNYSRFCGMMQQRIGSSQKLTAKSHGDLTVLQAWLWFGKTGG